MYYYIMENSEICSFILRTADIVNFDGSLVTNPAGTKNDAYGASFTWQNIDLKAIMGKKMYEENDYFSLSLIACPASICYTSSHGSSEVGSNIMMSGLSWNNCNYSYQSKTNRTKAYVGTLLENNSTTSLNLYFVQQSNDVCNCFSKSSPIVDLTIELFRSRAGVLSVPFNAGAGYIFPQTAYIFNIVPIKRENRYANLWLQTVIDSTGTASKRTWSAYDIRAAIGDLWYEYDTFNLELTQIVSDFNTTLRTGADISCIVNLAGLPFLNPNKTDVNICQFSNNFVLQLFSVKNTVSTVAFSNSSPIVDLVITFNQATSNLQLTANASQTIFIFKITGLKRKA